MKQFLPYLMFGGAALLLYKQYQAGAFDGLLGGGTTTPPPAAGGTTPSAVTPPAGATRAQRIQNAIDYGIPQANDFTPAELASIFEGQKVKAVAIGKVLAQPIWAGYQALYVTPPQESTRPGALVDQLRTAAGTSGGLNKHQWSYFYARLVGRNPLDASVLDVWDGDDTPLTVEQFVSGLNSKGISGYRRVIQIPRMYIPRRAS